LQTQKEIVEYFLYCFTAHLSRLNRGSPHSFEAQSPRRCVYFPSPLRGAAMRKPSAACAAETTQILCDLCVFVVIINYLMIISLLSKKSNKINIKNRGQRTEGRSRMSEGRS
jgi:hypothetical protein